MPDTSSPPVYSENFLAVVSDLEATEREYDRSERHMWDLVEEHEHAEAEGTPDLHSAEIKKVQEQLEQLHEKLGNLRALCKVMSTSNR